MKPGYLLMPACFPCFFNPPEVRGERKLYTLLFLPALAAIPTFRKKIPRAGSRHPGQLPGLTVAGPQLRRALPSTTAPLCP